MFVWLNKMLKGFSFDKYRAGFLNICHYWHFGPGNSLLWAWIGCWLSSPLPWGCQCLTSSPSCTFNKIHPQLRSASVESSTTGRPVKARAGLEIKILFALILSNIPTIVNLNSSNLYESDSQIWTFRADSLKPCLSCCLLGIPLWMAYNPCKKLRMPSSWFSNTIKGLTGIYHWGTLEFSLSGTPHSSLTIT